MSKPKMFSYAEQGLPYIIPEYPDKNKNDFSKVHCLEYLKQHKKSLQHKCQTKASRFQNTQPF